MGLSAIEVPSDQENLMQSNNLDFPKSPPTRGNLQEQHQQQKTESLECPRCSSKNTKFCYYNNYNRSQPRHFCKACKRHWTKGGSLRNVPAGGGRKNKRLKLSDSANSIRDPQIFAQNQEIGCVVGHQKSISDSTFRDLIDQNPSSDSLQKDDTLKNFSGKTFLGIRNGSFPFSTPLTSQDQSFQFSFSNFGCFDSNPCSISTDCNQPSDDYGYYTKRPDTSLESTITTVMPTSSSILTQQWRNPITSGGAMEMSSDWNWNEINSLVSADLDIPWDDTEIKF